MIFILREILSRDFRKSQVPCGTFVCEHIHKKVKKTLAVFLTFDYTVFEG